MSPEDIRHEHREKIAYVYIRQSTERQVVDHRESLRRQRALGKRAVELGWKLERIVEIDSDLGCSAASSSKRQGFEELVAEAAVGNVGIIVALDVSRLARSNHDWHRLLDICAVTSTLIADAEGLYDPRSYNDRLLLGLKGAMSEAELHIMKQRMIEAIRHKAQRGEFQFRPGPGYVWDETGRLVKTPDEQVQSVLGLLFSRFERLGTVHQTHLSLIEDRIDVPVRGARKGRLDWTSPSYSYVLRVLGNPLYAGAYVFGQRQVSQSVGSDGRVKKRVRRVSPDQWHVLVKDHHEGYIDWSVFERNQQMISSNSRQPLGAGAPKRGRALLCGLLLCGRCGRRMRVRYGGKSNWFRFECTQARRQIGSEICMSVGATRLQDAVEARVVEMLEPAGMAAMTQAAQKVEATRHEQQQLWEQRLERSRYEVTFAQRQFDAVDPDNRLVARTLERRYEQALAQVKEVQHRAAQHIETIPSHLTTEEKGQLEHYAQNIRALWNSPTTRIEDKKRIVRCLFESIVVNIDDESISAALHWVSGLVETVTVKRGRRDPRAVDEDHVALVRKLAATLSDAEISRVFHRRGIRSPEGLTYDARRVGCLRFRYGIPNGPGLPKDPSEIYTAQQAARILDVTHTTVMRWVHLGLLRGTQVMRGAPWRVVVTAADKERLIGDRAPEGWVPIKTAASKLKVSTVTILNKLKEGALQGKLIQQGNQRVWRIQMPTGTYGPQSEMYQ